MPSHKYRVETDKGAYEVEVEDSAPSTPQPHQTLADMMANVPTDEAGNRLPPHGVGETLSANPILRAAAKPSSTSDLLPLLIPGGVSVGLEGISGAMRGYKRAYDVASDGGKTIPQTLKGLYKVLSEGNYLDTVASNKAAVDKFFGSGAPHVDVSAPVTGKWSNPILDSLDSRAKPRPPLNVRPAPSKAPNLQDVLQEALKSEPDKPSMVSGPPSVMDMTKAGKPAVSGGRPASGLGADAPPPSEVTAPVSAPQSVTHYTPQIEPRVTRIDPSKLTPSTWQELRGYYGADELSKLTGVPAEMIRSTHAVGPSRIPGSIQDRLMGYQLQQILADPRK